MPGELSGDVYMNALGVMETPVMASTSPGGDSIPHPCTLLGNAGAVLGNNAAGVAARAFPNRNTQRGSHDEPLFVSRTPFITAQ